MATESCLGEQCIAEREAAPEAAPFLLYGSWFCPYVQRVWMCLEELSAREEGFAYRYAEINPYADPGAESANTKQALPLEEKARRYPAFVRASPRGLVPALVHGGDAVNDSLVCCEYLADVAPPGALLPSAPFRRAQVRMWIEHVNTQVIPFFYKCLMQQDPAVQHQMLAQMMDGLASANAKMLAVSPSGCFLGGDEFSLADVALAPWWQRMLVVLTPYRGFACQDDDPQYARLQDWWAAVSARGAFRRSRVADARLVGNYSGYANNSATSEAARTFR